MGKIEKSKEKKYKILKKTLDDSYENKITKLDDLEESLKDKQVLPETRDLEKLGCLDKTIRGDTLTWGLSGKAKSSMEKNPKNYDEFLDFYEDKPKNPEPIQPTGGESVGWKITKKTVGFITGGGILAILVLLFAVVSFPNILVEMHVTDDSMIITDNSWGSQNIQVIIDEEDNRFNSFSNICFRVSNTGQSIGDLKIPANNMKVHVSTDAICKDCKNNENVGLLYAQEHTNICNEIQISNGTQHFNFQIISQYDALWKHTKTDTYNCDFVEVFQSEVMLTKDLVYSCSLE